MKPASFVIIACVCAVPIASQGVEHIPGVHFALTKNDIMSQTPPINDGVPHPLFVRLHNIAYRYGRSIPFEASCRVVMGVDRLSNSFYLFHFEAEATEPHYFAGGGQPGCDGKWQFDKPTDVCYYYLHYSNPSEDRYYIYVVDSECASIKSYTYYTHRYNAQGARMEDYIDLNGVYGQEYLVAPVSVSMLTSSPPNVLVLDIATQTIHSFSMNGQYNYPITIDIGTYFTPRKIRTSQFTSPAQVLVCGSTGTQDILVKYTIYGSTWVETARIYPDSKVLDIAYSTTYGFLVLLEGGTLYCELDGILESIDTIANIAQADDRLLRMAASADRLLLATEYTNNNGLREFGIGNILLSVSSSAICHGCDNLLSIRGIVPATVKILFQDLGSASQIEIATTNIVRGLNTRSIPIETLQGFTHGKFIVQRFSDQVLVEQIESNPVVIWQHPEISLNSSSASGEVCSNHHLNVNYNLNYASAENIMAVNFQFLPYSSGYAVETRSIENWSLGQNIAQVRAPGVPYQEERIYTVRLCVRTAYGWYYDTSQSTLTVNGCYPPPPGPPRIADPEDPLPGDKESEGFYETILSGKVCTVIDNTRNDNCFVYVVRAKDYTKLSLYDLRGRRVRASVTTEIGERFVIVRIDARSLASGVYFVAGGGNAKAVAKFVNVR